MTVRTPEEAKEEVRNATDIVQIVGERVPLRRTGRTWKGLCPFHSEKTPSFTVNSERQIWHCFGCNRGGDVFSFLMEMDKVTFPEALGVLAERAGVELPRGRRGEGDAKREQLYQANALANDFFKASLRSPAGAGARSYLARRHYDDALLDRFQVGWAPESWDALAIALGRLLPKEALEAAGLTLRRGDGTHYDRFRNRVTFPIEASAGRIAGFGARALADEEQAKYINSPETLVYRKGGLLFGVSLARAAIRERKQVLVTEGYLDVMRLHAAGQAHAVCTCGTALTSDQARLLARFESEIILVYDGDDAGVRAAERGLEPLLQAGLAVRVVLLPEGHDPDSFIAAKGPAAFAEALDAASDVATFLARASLARSGSNPSPEARVRRYVELLRHVDDPIRRRLMVRRGSAVFGLEEDVILEALSKGGGRRSAQARTGGSPGAAGVRSEGAVSRPGGPPARNAGLPGAVAAPAPGAPGAPDQVEDEPLDPIEKELAARCLTEEGAVAEVVESGGVNCFQNRSLQKLLATWLTMGRAPLPEELRALADMEPLARILLAEHPVEDGRTDEVSRRGVRELLQRLAERRLRTSIHTLDLAIRQAERTQDQGSLDRLVAERRDLASKLHSHNQPAGR